MNLSDGEKLILVMLSDIYKHLKIRGEVDPELVQSAIFDGNTWGLKWAYHGIFSSEETSEDVVDEVVNILDMWSFIESSYKELSASDKARVDTEAHPFGKKPKFQGFDANGEIDHLGAARFLVEKLGRFSEFKGRDFNSHYPGTLATHRRMFKAFEPIRESAVSGQLSASQLIQILKERIHPDHRK